jgi:hypothetical protein
MRKVVILAIAAAALCLAGVTWVWLTPEVKGLASVEPARETQGSPIVQTRVGIPAESSTPGPSSELVAKTSAPLSPTPSPDQEVLKDLQSRYSSAQNERIFVEFAKTNVSSGGGSYAAAILRHCSFMRSLKGTLEATPSGGKSGRLAAAELLLSRCSDFSDNELSHIEIENYRKGVRGRDPSLALYNTLFQSLQSRPSAEVRFQLLQLILDNPDPVLWTQLLLSAVIYTPPEVEKITLYLHGVPNGGVQYERMERAFSIGVCMVLKHCDGAENRIALVACVQSGICGKSFIDIVLAEEPDPQARRQTMLVAGAVATALSSKNAAAFMKP